MLFPALRLTISQADRSGGRTYHVHYHTGIVAYNSAPGDGWLLPGFTASNPSVAREGASLRETVARFVGCLAHPEDSAIVLRPDSPVAISLDCRRPLYQTAGGALLQTCGTK